MAGSPFQTELLPITEAVWMLNTNVAVRIRTNVVSAGMRELMRAWAVPSVTSHIGRVPKRVTAGGAGLGSPIELPDLLSL